MPMLTTFRMRLPVWPFHSPLRTRLAKPAILSSTACTSGTTFFPSTTIEALARRAEGDVEDGPVLGDVDLLPPEHGVDPGAQARLLGQPDEEPQRLVGDAVLRVVEEEAGALGGQALAARRVVGEERPQMNVAHGPGVRLERLPRRAGQ